MTRIAAVLAVAAATGCAGAPDRASVPGATPDEASGGAGEARETEVAVYLLRDDGDVARVIDPRARRVDRRADLEPNATLIAPDVALVVEPARGAPEYVSNILGGALTRRFAGHTPIRQAMAAAEVFVVSPVVSPPSQAGEDMLVDWKIFADGRRPVGAVFARRRLTGEPGASPWAALTTADAEHVALQTAAAIERTPAIRDAMNGAAARARLERTPTPRARPDRDG